MNRFIAWESALERDFYYLAEFDPAQPIQFNGDGSQYTPDSKVELSK